MLINIYVREAAEGQAGLGPGQGLPLDAHLLHGLQGALSHLQVGLVGVDAGVGSQVLEAHRYGSF